MAEQWDANFKSASLTISGAKSNIVTNTVGGAHAMARGTVTAAGDLYYEVVMSSAFGSSAGFCDSTSGTNDAMGGGTYSGHSIGAYGPSGSFQTLFQGTADGTGTGTGGDRLGLAISQTRFKKFWWKDLTSASGWFPSGDPSSGAGGKDITGAGVATAAQIYPGCSIFNKNDTVTAFWASSDLTGAIPTSYGLFLTAKTATFTLDNLQNSPLPNLSVLHWAWWDVTNIDAITGGPVASGAIETTDANGVIQLSLNASSLSSGQLGLLGLHANDWQTSGNAGLYLIPLD